MDDPNLIAVLIPIDQNGYAETAFRRPQNRVRCLLPSDLDAKSTIGSRDPTPARSLSPNNDAEVEGKHCILLAFEPPPKDVTNGFAFGTDVEKCDVVLGSRGVREMSKVHFHIKFDMISGERCLVLRDSSTNGSAVSYDGEAEIEVRRHFTWILNPKENARKKDVLRAWQVKVHVRGLAFIVKLAFPEKMKAEYERRVDRFLYYSRTPAEPFRMLGKKNSLHRVAYEQSIDAFMTEAARGLNVDRSDTVTAPSQSDSPRRRRIYISVGNIGRGSFGSVDKVIDVSTGRTWARKTFLPPPQGEEDRWLPGIRREIRIMKDYPHNHMISLEDAREEAPPFLVMPYVPLGNLLDVQASAPLEAEEVPKILVQGLYVLEHLHSRGVAYRDLKPANILVQTRSPLHLLFTDFGLANDQPNLATFCGSRKYMAPEIFSGHQYTRAVDIWSLGVIGLEFAYGLPQPSHYEGRAQRHRSRDWKRCVDIVRYANDWDPDPLIDLLVTMMLLMNPQERSSATDCLHWGHRLGLFDPSTLNSKHVGTIGLGPSSRIGLEEDASTIIDGAMWEANVSAVDAEGSNSIHVTRTATYCHIPEGHGDHLAPQLPQGRVKALPDPNTEESSEHASRSIHSSVLLGKKRHRCAAVASPDSPVIDAKPKRRPPSGAPVGDAPSEYDYQQPAKISSSQYENIPVALATFSDTC